MAFIVAENKNRQLEDLPRADFSWVVERFLLPVKKKSITENFVHWKLPPLLFFVVIQRFFSILSLIADELYDFYAGIDDPFIFIRQLSRFYLSGKGYCV